MQQFRLPMQTAGISFRMKNQERRRTRMNETDRRSLPFPIVGWIAAAKSRFVMARLSAQFVSRDITQIEASAANSDHPCEHFGQQSQLRLRPGIQGNTRRQISASGMAADKKPAGIAAIFSQ